MLVPMRKENAVMISTFAGAIVDLILNAIFIPFLGSVGAAIGTLVAEFVVLIVQMMYLKDNIKYLYSKQEYFKLIVALLFATIGAILVKVSVSAIFIKLVISAIIFFGIYMLLLYMMKEEIVTENIDKMSKKLIRGLRK